MITSQWIFVVFYAIFWGTIASVYGRWKMFHWPLIHHPFVAARLVLSFLLLNIFPILYFAFVLYLLQNPAEAQANQWTWWETLRKVVAGVTPAFAIFGFYRSWVAIVDFHPTRFYKTKAELKDMGLEGVEQGSDELNLEPKYGHMNLIFALLYLLFATAIPWLLTR